MEKSLRAVAAVVSVLALAACGSGAEKEPDREDSKFGSPCRLYNSVDNCAVAVMGVVAEVGLNMEISPFPSSEKSNGSRDVEAAYQDWKDACVGGGEDMVGDLDPACIDILDRIAEAHRAVVGPPSN